MLFSPEKIHHKCCMMSRGDPSYNMKGCCIQYMGKGNYDGKSSKLTITS